MHNFIRKTQLFGGLILFQNQQKKLMIWNCGKFLRSFLFCFQDNIFHLSENNIFYLNAFRKQKISIFLSENKNFPLREMLLRQIYKKFIYILKLYDELNHFGPKPKNFPSGNFLGKFQFLPKKDVLQRNKFRMEGNFCFC